MNIAKNMEVIFVAVLALVSVTGLATASARAPAAAITATVATDGAMPVVTVSARRMSAAEKAATAR